MFGGRWLYTGVIDAEEMVEFRIPYTARRLSVLSNSRSPGMGRVLDHKTPSLSGGCIKSPFQYASLGAKLGMCMSHVEVGLVSNFFNIST